MATHCQMDVWSGSSDCQNIGAVNSFEGKKRGRSTSNYALIRVVACKMCLFSCYFVKYMIFITLHALLNYWSPFCIQFCIVLRKFDFRGLWSVSPKNRGQSRKTHDQERTGMKKQGR